MGWVSLARWASSKDYGATGRLGWRVEGVSWAFRASGSRSTHLSDFPLEFTMLRAQARVHAAATGGGGAA